MKIYFIKKISDNNNKIYKILTLNKFVECYLTSYNQDLNKFN